MEHKTWCLATWLLVFLWFPLVLEAVGLTEEQYQLLKTDITVTHASEFSQAVADNNDAFISNAYNQLASPVFWVWVSSLTDKGIYENVSPDGTVWNWTTFIQQSVQERDAWSVMLRSGVINPSLSQTRGAFTKIFSGTGAPLAQQQFLLSLSRRKALRIEALMMISGSGDGSTATPANMAYEGIIGPLDIAHCLRGVPIP